MSRPAGATNEPGPRLNGEVAMRVLGWRRDDPDDTRAEPLYITSSGRVRFASEIPAYSTDVTAAMTLLDAWPHDWSIRRTGGRYIVTICRPTGNALDSGLATADCLEQAHESLALAIVYVRLRAVGW